MERSKSSYSFVRADKLGYGDWDMERAKNFVKSLELERAKKSAAVRSLDADRKEDGDRKEVIWEKREDWDIDLSKLVAKGVIGKGSYGTVYRCVYENQDCAVKILDWPEDGASENARSSFRKEIDVWSKLDHPNVTKFIGASMGSSGVKLPYDNSPYSETCCIALEYLQGGSLKNYLIRNRRQKLPLRVVVQIALDIAHGLSYLHSKNIVHRDVKTENMLLNTNRTVKLTDFGVARVESENMTGGTGTINYMAPEVIDGKPYNKKCDVYSFGICLWEIYCCQMPYANLNFSEISSRVVKKDLRPSIPKCCPSPFAKIIKKCWDKKPENRPEMVEVVKMLEALDTSNGGGMVPEDQSSVGCFCLGPRGP